MLLGVLCGCTASVPAAHEPRVPGGALVRLGDPRFTHSAAVDRIAVCGDVVIATDRGGIVRAWDAASGEGRGTWSFAPAEDRFVRVGCAGPHIVRASGERATLVARSVKTSLGGDVLDAVGTTVVRVDRVERNAKAIATFGDATVARLSHDGRAVAVFIPSEGVLLVYAELARAPARVVADAEIAALEWSDDDRRLLVTRIDHVVEVRTPDGKLERRFGGLAKVDALGSAVTAAAASARMIAIGTKSGLLYRFDAITGERRKPLQATDGALTALGFSADGARLALGTDRHVRVIATLATELAKDEPRGIPLDAVFSRDGTRVATVGTDGVLRIWNATTGVQLSELAAAVPEDRKPLASVAWSLAGVVAVDDDGVVRRWDDHTWTRTEVAMASRMISFATSLDHSLLGTATPEGWWLYDAGRLAPRSHGVPAPAPGPADVTSLSLDATGSRFAYCVHSTGPAMVEVVARDGTRVTHLTLVGSACPALALSPDGGQLALGTGLLVSLADTHQRTMFSHGDHDLLAFAPDGKVIVTAHGSELEVIDVASHEVHALAGHTGAIHSIAWSPAGDRFVTTSGDLTAIVWKR